MTRPTKEDWKRAKAEVEAIQKERDALLAPTKERYDAARDRLEMIEDECPEIIGRCEGCSEPIFDGEPHSGGDDPLCEECAPTYADMLERPDCFTESDGEVMTP